MVKNGRAWLLVAALVAMGCGDDGGVEPGTDGGPRADGGPGSDGGGTGTDAMVGGDSGPGACAAAMANAASTAGCNGGFVATPAANAPGGTCTPGSDAMPAGSCTTAGAICMGSITGSGGGTCVVSCDAPETYVDAQTCPTGFRCFRYGDGVDAFGLCARDCNAENPCQEGWECTGEGRCAESEG